MLFFFLSFFLFFLFSPYQLLHCTGHHYYCLSSFFLSFFTSFFFFFRDVELPQGLHARTLLSHVSRRARPPPAATPPNARRCHRFAAAAAAAIPPAHHHGQRHYIRRSVVPRHPHHHHHQRRPPCRVFYAVDVCGLARDDADHHAAVVAADQRQSRAVHRHRRAVWQDRLPDSDQGVSHCLPHHQQQQQQQKCLAVTPASAAAAADATACLRLAPLAACAVGGPAAVRCSGRQVRRHRRLLLRRLLFPTRVLAAPGCWDVGGRHLDYHDSRLRRLVHEQRERICTGGPFRAAVRAAHTVAAAGVLLGEQHDRCDKGHDGRRGGGGDVGEPRCRVARLRRDAPTAPAGLLQQLDRPRPRYRPARGGTVHPHRRGAVHATAGAQDDERDSVRARGAVRGLCEALQPKSRIWLPDRDAPHQTRRRSRALLRLDDIGTERQPQLILRLCPRIRAGVPCPSPPR